MELQEEIEDKWSEWIKLKNFSEETIHLYTLRLKKFLLLIDMGIPINQTTVITFISEFNDNVTRAFMKNFLEMMEIKDITIPKKTGAVAVVKKKPLTETERKGVVDMIYKRGINYGLVTELLYDCALRVKEAVSIRTEDFDLEAWSRDTTDKCRLLITIKGAKRKKERWVIVSSDLMKKIIKYLQQFEYPNHEKYGTFRVSLKSYMNRFFETIRRLGFNFGTHNLRVTRATNWRNEGSDIMTIKRRLGHSSITTTERYVNDDEEQELLKWEQEK
jgi:integrase